MTEPKPTPTATVRNPLAGNPLQTRADLQTAVRALFEPLKPHFSSSGARVQVEPTPESRTRTTLRSGLVAVSPFTGPFANTLALGLFGGKKARRWQRRLRRPEELEGFARPLWGLVPLAAGGGTFDDWALYRRGLEHGTNPAHPDYWGGRLERSQVLVEMAAVGFGLALAPEHLWEPLTPNVQKNVARWLSYINKVEVADNNWLFFRVLVNTGLARVGAPHDAAALESALTRLETFYQGDGWYSDGPKAQLDYYVAFALHYYGLIYAKLAADTDPKRAQRFRDRAATFAQDYMHWFAEDGSALPFGRSLTYRFAQGAFWGALAFAEVEALPWSVTKGLALRHLRWWASQPIFDAAGILSVGYTYPNDSVAEDYSSPASPYWALKAFLPLALDAAHPFWTVEEAPLPPLEPVRPQPQPGLVICRDAENNHVFALSGRQYAPDWLKHGAAKYAKFAYSSAFGFSVPTGRGAAGHTLRHGAFDSTLALSRDGQLYKARERPDVFKLEGAVVHTTWTLGPDVRVETWLLPLLPWHVRVHHLRTDAQLYSAEGGFALPWTGSAVPAGLSLVAETGQALASAGFGCSGLRSLNNGLNDSLNDNLRLGEIIEVEAETNVLHPHTVIPTLKARHEPGEHWLACAVLALPQVDGDELQRLWLEPPALDIEAKRLTVSYQGRVLELTAFSETRGV